MTFCRVVLFCCSSLQHYFSVLQVIKAGYGSEQSSHSFVCICSPLPSSHFPCHQWRHTLLWHCFWSGQLFSAQKFSNFLWYSIGCSPPAPETQFCFFEYEAVSSDCLAKLIFHWFPQHISWTTSCSELFPLAEDSYIKLIVQWFYLIAQLWLINSSPFDLWALFDASTFMLWECTQEFYFLLTETYSWRWAYHNYSWGSQSTRLDWAQFDSLRKFMSWIEWVGI